MKIENHLPVVLLLSASDPEGTLGIQADISMLSSMKRRVFVSTVVTSYILRSPNGRLRLKAVSPEVLRSQISMAVATFHPDVVKIGVVADPLTVCEIAAVLRKRHVRKIIYSPCWEDENGVRLISEETVKFVCCHLLPLVRLLIVQRPYAECLIRAQRGKDFPVETLTNVQLSRCIISTFYCSCYLFVPGQRDILALATKVFYYSPVEKSKEMRDNSGKRFASAVAGCWADRKDVRLPLYEARIQVQNLSDRERYLNENHSTAPYFPLTDGGNYE